MQGGIASPPFGQAKLIPSGPASEPIRDALRLSENTVPNPILPLSRLAEGRLGGTAIKLRGLVPHGLRGNPMGCSASVVAQSANSFIPRRTSFILT